MPVYSFSKVNLFQQCALKFRYKYIDKYPDHDTKTIELILGSAVHEILEYLYARLNAQTMPTLDQCIAKFDQSRSSLFDDQVKYSADKTPEDYLHRGRAYISHYYQKYKPFDQNQTISLENRQFVFDLQDQIKFTGVIDRLAKQGGDFVIIDYKTGQKLPTMQQGEYRDQLTLYAHGVKQKYQRYHDTIHARLLYLHFDIEDSRVVTNESIDQVVSKYSQIISSIQDKATRYGFGDQEAFTPTEGPQCKFCPYQSICPLFNHLEAEDIVLHDVTIKNLIDQYVDQSKEISKLEHSKELKKELILNYLKQFPTLRLHGNKYHIAISKIDRYSPVDTEKMSLILKQLGVLDQVLKVDPHALTRLIKSGDLTLDMLGDTVSKKQTTVLRSMK